MILLNGKTANRLSAFRALCRTRLSALCVLVLCVVSFAAEAQQRHLPVRRVHREQPDSTEVAIPAAQQPDSISADDVPATVISDGENITISVGDSKLTGELVPAVVPDSVAGVQESPYDRWEEREVLFNPDPMRAVWLSALFPGLGQLYNRRYWKLPIVIGAYMGLGYATTWNGGMLTDYTKAYRDIMDTDPSTNSYMNLFPPTTNESDIDKRWLTNVLQSRKNYFRRNRDLCIIAMVGVYLVAMVDAYVDASLSHFDITPDLSFDVSPVMFQEVRGQKPSIGLMWAFNF